jgi:hypothetical protein
MIARTTAMSRVDSVCWPLPFRGLSDRDRLEVSSFIRGVPFVTGRTVKIDPAFATGYARRVYPYNEVRPCFANGRDASSSSLVRFRAGFPHRLFYSRRSWEPLTKIMLIYQRIEDFVLDELHDFERGGPIFIDLLLPRNLERVTVRYRIANPKKFIDLWLMFINSRVVKSKLKKVLFENQGT